MSSVAKITRKDVAARAGVSETIVSNVLNNNRYVAEDKRQRVLRAVQELNYHPNNNARALRGKFSGHIMFIADDIANEHFGHLVSKMDEFGHDQGYLISLTGYWNSEDFIRRVISRQPDGIVISSNSFRREYIRMLADCGIPVVLIGSRDYEDIDSKVSVVYTGLDEGIRKGVQLLAQKGRKHLVHIDRISAKGHFSNMQDLRYRSFCEAVLDNGMTLSKDSIISGCHNEDELLASIEARIQSGAPIDGIIARNDALAAVAVTAIRNCGLSVPDDIAVVGFDNSRISRITYPQLTTVQIDQAKVASAIFSTLNSMQNGGEPVHLHFQTILIERKST